MPSTDWKEIIAADEQARFAGYAEQIAAIQKKRGAPARGFHPKALLSARAEFTVLSDLPEHARQGLFAEPKTYAAWVRYSNGSIRVQDDHKGDVRGLVIKVLDVPGKKVIAALGQAQTQNFSMIQVPALVFKNAAEFMWFVGAAQKPLTLLPRMIGFLGLGRTLRALGELRKGMLKPIATLAAVQFWSPMPIQYGLYAVRYSVRPVSPPAPPPPSASPDYLGEDLAQRLRAGPLVYDFEVQFFVDEKTTPIEDTSVVWPGPWLKVGRLTLPQQDVASADGKTLAQRIEAVSFNPWAALQAHRPLGDMMRARDPAYLASSTTRGADAEP